MNIKIIGSGVYIPENKIKNIDFCQHSFYNEEGAALKDSNEVIAEKFRNITGIEERRYVDDDLKTSDIATIAAQRAIEDAGVDPEILDYIILAHNFGDVTNKTDQTDILPSLASRVKHGLKIKNPKCVAYDMLFGCPGWLEGVIQAQAFIKAGMAKTCLIIGAETLSRVVDKHDRDSMIYADGAGATIIQSTSLNGGIKTFSTATYAHDEAFYLYYGPSYNKELNPDIKYIKMHGRKIYEFALTHVPQAMAECLAKSTFPIEKIKKILIHQANEKMDEAIIQRFYRLFKQQPPHDIMPMSIHKLGNSSVATIPTLYHLLMKNELGNHSLTAGDVIMFASVGAGMNINAMVYEI